jgi:uncharacterized RDD family membrane protein YckC
MKTIDVITTQNVRIEYELAGVWDRILAFLIDLAVLGALLTVLSLTLGVLGVQAQWVFLIVLLPPVIFYTPLMEFFNNGQSLGKMAMRLKVLQVDGKHPELLDIIIRWAFRFLEIWMTLGSMAIILISTGDLSQRLGGRLSNTTIVRLNVRRHLLLDQLLEIEDLSQYTPRFPQVRQFNEQEMLVMKSALDRYETFRNTAHAESVKDVVERVKAFTGMEPGELSPSVFLRTLIQDYVVLTR